MQILGAHTLGEPWDHADISDSKVSQGSFYHLLFVNLQLVFSDGEKPVSHPQQFID